MTSKKMQKNALINRLNKLISLFPKITKDFFVYTIGGSISQVIAFLTIPIITRILPASDYGSVDVILAGIHIFSFFISLNITSGFSRFFLEVPNDDQEEKRKIVSSVFWFIFCTGTIVTVLGYFISPFISQQLFSSNKFIVAIQIAFASSIFFVLKEFFLAIYNLERKPVRYMILNLSLAIINFLLILFFVLILKKGVAGYFLAYLISNMLIASVVGFLQRDYLGFCYSRKWFSEMAAYGLPLLPGTFFSWGLGSINRIILTQFTTTTQIAYYSVAGKPAKILEFVAFNFALAWRPVLLANLDNKKIQNKIVDLLSYYSNSGIILAAFVTVIAKEIIGILAPQDYLVGAGLVGALSLKFILNHFGEMTGVGIVKTKKTHLFSVSMGFGVATTLGVSLLLIPRYGILGAAIADLVGELVCQSLYIYFSSKLIDIRWNLLPIILTLGGYSTLWYLSTAINLDNKVFDLSLRLILFSLFVVYVMFFVDRMFMLRKFFSFLSKNKERNPKETSDKNA